MTGAWVAMLVTGVVAVISVVMWIANVATPPRLASPLAPVVLPAVTAAAGFTGTLAGFLFVVGRRNATRFPGGVARVVGAAPGGVVAGCDPKERVMT